MEECPATIKTISDLINSGSPLTAAASLVPTRPIDHRRSSDQNRRCLEPNCPNPNVQTLKPLNYPALLIGTINLPSPSDNRLKCNCFRFSDDDSTAVCCEVLEFDAKMIGQKIRVLAWNFIPFRHAIRGGKGGFLEIITWEFFQAGSGSPCSFSDDSCYCLSLGVCDGRNSLSILGVIDSISPVSVVPWETRGGDSKDVNGFLVHILVCQCTDCASKSVVSKLRGVCEGNVEHHFNTSRIAYFSGLASSWHPVISRFIGDVVLLMGLEKRLVFFRKEESQLMYVTTDRVSLHVAKLSKKVRLNQNTDMRGKRKWGSYTGVVTGSYMCGKILELDQDVILLLTEQHLVLPHYVRVGVLVTIKNVDFVDPKFRWGKMLILGACTRTSMHLQSFSPLESWCHLKKPYPRCLQKFIDSLAYAARLWALLVISCFEKILAGKFSEKKILGSRHEVGLAQKYARLHLPSSAFQIRHGVLLEFCRHEDLCFNDKEVDYGRLKLVLPIANLISYCESLWKNLFNSQENYPDVMGGIDRQSPLCCGRTSYVQSIRRVWCSEEIGVVALGTLEISPSSGRLQLVDATGSVDFIINLPQTWDFEMTIEVKDFKIIMEDRVPEMADLSSTIYQPLSCRSIFSNALPSRKLNASIYLYHCSSDVDPRSCSLFSQCKGNSQDFDSEKYHLLYLTHKFPIQQKVVQILGALAKVSIMFAEAIVLPWDLLVAGKYKDAMPTINFSGHREDPLKRIARTSEHFAPKRCKTDHLAQVSKSRVDDAGDVSRSHFNGLCSSHGNSHIENSCSNNGIDLSCQNISGVKIHWTGMLHRDSKRAEVVSSSKPPRKVLLEFAPDCILKYELLKIGRCYLVKHEEGDTLCKGNLQASHTKVFIGSGTQLRCLTFSSIQSIRSAGLADEFPFRYLRDSSDELTNNSHELEIPCLISDSMDYESYSYINIFVPSSAINLLDNYMKIFDGISNEPRDSFKEESSIHDHSGLMINSSKQSSGDSCSDCPLPQGNLITLHGLVLDIHDCPGESSELTFLHKNAGICVHVIVDNHTVQISGYGSQETCPIGFGRDVYATFHRVLVLSEPGKYMMTAASFITVNHASLMRGHHDHEHSNAPTTVVSRNVVPEYTVSIALISDALQLSELRPMQFRCKVVALYILKLEKARSTAIIHSPAQSIQSAFRIPFAGFIVDDGSSSCCCWADSKNAASFLGLNCEEYLLKDMLGRCNTGKGQLQISTIGRLNQALDRRGRIVVKNRGSMFDSSSQDLEFRVGSGRSLSSREEDLFQSLVTKATLGPSLRIVGSLMDSKTTTWLKECLTEHNFDFPDKPKLLNIWATSVCRMDTLLEARSIIRELV